MEKNKENEEEEEKKKRLEVEWNGGYGGRVSKSKEILFRGINTCTSLGKLFERETKFERIRCKEIGLELM